jgi:hypothetical protein
MSKRFIFQLVLRLQIAFVFAAFFSVSPSAQKPAGSPAQSRESVSALQENRLVAHEWGTFTSIAGLDGAALEWRPLNGASDLPGFVYQINRDAAKGLRHNYASKASRESLIRMETPVIYFYADRETVVSAKVAFPSGKITEWYPQARALEGGIDWGRFTVLPDARVALPAEAGDSHYYPARETDANILRICGTRQIQHEKFLFYRGVGNFNPPLNVRLEGEQIVLKNLQSAGIAQAVIFENRNGRSAYRVVDLLNNEAAVPRSSVNQNPQALEQELEKMLLAQGLYEREAKAMLKTWRGSWFEEGLRVFYLLPGSITDVLLPIQIEPHPTELVRVMVCRTEVITPEMEASLEAAIVNLDSPVAAKRLQAKKVVDQYGRFAEPILKRVMQQSSDSAVQLRIARLLKSSRR